MQEQSASKSLTRTGRLAAIACTLLLLIAAASAQSADPESGSYRCSKPDALVFAIVVVNAGKEIRGVLDSNAIAVEFVRSTKRSQLPLGSPQSHP